MHAYLRMAVGFLLMASTGCSQMDATAVESPQDGLKLRLSFSEDYLRFTVSLRNTSDHTIYVLDELRPVSKVRFASGPTEVYVEDLQGKALSNSPELGARHWWLAGSSVQSQGAEFPNDYVGLKPNAEISGTFLTQAALLLVFREAPFDKWKMDKVVKFRAWASYSVDRVEEHETKVESAWIPGCLIKGK